MDGNTPIYSIAVPTNLLSDRNISATAKLLYGVIDSFQRKSGVCYASNDRLSEEIAGCSARTISRAIAELKEAGYIDVDDAKGRSIYISASISGGLEGRQKCLPLLEEPHAPHDKIGEGGSQNCLPSNTVSKKEKNNITSNKSDELDLSFDRIYENYPKKVGKSRAKQIYKALLTKGRKIDGKTVKFTHEDICAGLNVYYNDKTEPNNGAVGDLKYWMNFDTLMNRIQDYVERRDELDE